MKYAEKEHDFEKYQNVKNRHRNYEVQGQRKMFTRFEWFKNKGLQTPTIKPFNITGCKMTMG